MNKTDLKVIFKNYLVLLECHNEQKRHISAYFRQFNINSVCYPMFTADYSFMIMPNHILKNKQPVFFGNDFLIERKSGKESKGGGFSEIRGNLTTGHKQFKAEFERMKNVRDVILLIENAKDYNDIYKVPQLQQPIMQFIKSYNSFICNRNEERKKDIQIVYTPLEDSGKKIAELIFNYLLEKFKDL